MPVIVMPQTLVSLSKFLELHNLTLMVRETGASKWEASFDPELLQDTGEDDDGTLVLRPVTTEGASTQEAVQAMCTFLSGREGLTVDDEHGSIEVDLYYTRVECDWDGGEEDADPSAPSLMKAALRHHGGE